MIEKEPTVDESLAPPRLIEHPQKIVTAVSRVQRPPPGMSKKDAETEWMLAAERAFPDQHVPALSNRTPREAARDPALRPKLVQLVKQRVRAHDERNLETGRTDDINWLPRELDLPELIFDAPPWRPPPEPADGEDADGEELSDSDEIFGVDSNRPPPPPLPDEPLDVEEAFKRLQAGFDSLNSPDMAREEIIASGATIIEDVEDLTKDILTEDDFTFAITFVLYAWFALVPVGCLAPDIDFDDLERGFLSNLRQFEACAESGTPKKLESFFQSGPQPGLMMAVLGGFLDAVKRAPKKSRPAVDAQPIILALLKSVVDELDKALRLM